MISDYYQLLEVPYDASTQQIKQAYFAKAKEYHPDISGAENAEKFRLVNDAYATLIDSEKRRDYDMKLERGQDTTDFEEAFKPRKDSFADYNPEESVYHKLWQKYQDPKHFGIYEQKRKEYLQKFKETQLNNSPLYKKMTLDNHRDVNFGIGIWASVLFTMAVSYKYMAPTSIEKAINKKLQDEVDQIEAEINRQKNKRFNLD